MHKISREKLIDDKLQSDKHQNGKVLVDEMHTNDDKSNELNTQDDVDDVEDDDEEEELNEDDMQEVLSVVDKVSANGNGLNITTCISGNGQSK